MSRKKKSKWKPAYLALAILLGINGGFLFSNKFVVKSIKAIQPAVSKYQTGYKATDRQKLEKLIHEGAKHD